MMMRATTTGLLLSALLLSCGCNVESDPDDDGASTSSSSSGMDACLPQQQAAVSDQAMAEFVSCMVFKDWFDTGMGDLPQHTTLSGKTCVTCHSSGSGGILLGELPATFQSHRSEEGRSLIATASTSIPECVASIAISTSYQAKGATSEGNNHPGYSFEPFEAPLQAFFDLTFTRWSAAGPGPCQP